MTHSVQSHSYVGQSQWVRQDSVQDMTYLVLTALAVAGVAASFFFTLSLQTVCFIALGAISFGFYHLQRISAEASEEQNMRLAKLSRRIDKLRGDGVASAESLYAKISRLEDQMQQERSSIEPSNSFQYVEKEEPSRALYVEKQKEQIVMLRELIRHVISHGKEQREQNQLVAKQLLAALDGMQKNIKEQSRLYQATIQTFDQDQRHNTTIIQELRGMYATLVEGASKNCELSNEFVKETCRCFEDLLNRLQQQLHERGLMTVAKK